MEYGKIEQTKTKVLTSPLKVLTWCVSNKDDVQDRLSGIAYEIEDIDPITDEQKLAIMAYWGINEERDFEVYKLIFSDFEDVHVRLIALSNQEEREDPSSFGIRSIQFHDENKMHTLVQKKREDWSLENLLDSIESMNRHSSYLSVCSDDYIEEVDFYTKVLGMSASLVDDKVVIYQERERSFFLHLDQDAEEDHQTAVDRLPNLGWVMTSYETKDIGEILARCHATQNKVYRTPRKIHDPILGPVLTMCVLSPIGMVIEVYQEA